MALNPEKTLEEKENIDKEHHYNTKQNLGHLKSQLHYENAAFQGQTPKQYLMSQYLHLLWVDLNTGVPS